MTPGAVVGLNLTRLRREKGLTQEQLEERSEVSQQYLSGLEAGSVNPTVVILLRLAKALGVTAADLIAGVDEQAVLPKKKPRKARRSAACHDDRQVPDALARRVIDGVGDRGGGADDAEFANPLHARRIYLAILLGNHDHVDPGHVGVDGRELLAEAVVDIPAPLLVALRRFEQSGRHSPDHRAHILAVGRARVDDAPGGERAGHARHPDLARQPVDAHLHELGPEREHQRLALL